MSDLSDIAKLLLESGRDRIPRIPDRRSLRRLRRQGLLQYPDGFSLTVGAMRSALLTFKVAAKDPYVNAEVAAELNALVEKGEEWVRKHNVTPEVEKLRFADLPFPIYHTLWEIMVSQDGQAAAEELRKVDREMLVKKGYMEEGPIFAFLQVTPKGKLLVLDYGNPFLGLGGATKVALRFQVENA